MYRLLIDSILEWIFPSKCIFCSSILSINSEEKIFCQKCIEYFTYIEKPICIKCGRTVDEDADSVCNDCRNIQYKFVRNMSVFYYDDFVRHLIFKFKYGKGVYVGNKLGEIMSNYFFDNYIKNIDLIIPIPLHKSKQRARGFNQALILSKHISKKTGIPLSEKGLIRIKNTRPQSKLSISQRQKNLKDAFQINKTLNIQNKNILLIDDIFTSGSTINNCTKILHENGAKDVFSFTLSVTYKK